MPASQRAGSSAPWWDRSSAPLPLLASQHRRLGIDPGVPEGAARRGGPTRYHCRVPAVAASGGMPRTSHGPSSHQLAPCSRAVVVRLGRQFIVPFERIRGLAPEVPTRAWQGCWIIAMFLPVLAIQAGNTGRTGNLMAIGILILAYVATVAAAGLGAWVATSGPPTPLGARWRSASTTTSPFRMSAARQPRLPSRRFWWTPPGL